MEKILLEGDKDSIECYILDSTRLAGRDFILVSEVESGDGDCFILELIRAEGEENAYAPVEDEPLLDQLANIFGEQLENVDIEYE